MILHGAPLRVPGVSTRGIIDLELAGKPINVTTIFRVWGPVLMQRAVLNIYIDFLFLTCYGLFLFCLVRATAKWFTSWWRLPGKWLSRAMIVAALLDAIENILLLKMLNGSIGKELVASTYMFASAKFIIVFAGIAYILLCIVVRMFKLNSPPAINAFESF